MRARFLSSVLLVFALAFPGLAQDRRSAPSLDRVLPHIRQTVPGTFYDAEGPFLTPDGQASYRIKWGTPDGRIIWFSVDARSGHVIGGTPGSGRDRETAGARYNGRRDDNSGGWPGGSSGRSNWSDRGDDRPGGWNNGRDNDNPGWGGRDDDRRDDRRGSWGGGRDRDDRSGWGNSRDRDERGSWGSGRDRGERDRDRGNSRSNDRGNDRSNGWGNGRSGGGSSGSSGGRGGRDGGGDRHRRNGG